MLHGPCVALSEWQERLVGSRELIQGMEDFDDDVTDVSELLCNKQTNKQANRVFRFDIGIGTKQAVSLFCVTRLRTNNDYGSPKHSKLCMITKWSA